MSEERAQTLGYTPLAFIRSYAYAALDPGEQLLMGPVLAAPVALQRAGLTLARHGPRSRCTRRLPRRCCATSPGFESREWAERAGFTRAGRRSRSVEAQRDGRIDRDRTSVRRDGRTHSHDARQRARSSRRPVRPDDRVRRGWHGPRDGDRARMTRRFGRPATPPHAIDGRRRTTSSSSRSTRRATRSTRSVRRWSASSRASSGASMTIRSLKEWC